MLSSARVHTSKGVKDAPHPPSTASKGRPSGTSTKLSDDDAHQTAQTVTLPDTDANASSVATPNAEAATPASASVSSPLEVATFDLHADGFGGASHAATAGFTAPAMLLNDTTGPTTGLHGASALAGSKTPLTTAGPPPSMDPASVQEVQQRQQTEVRIPRMPQQKPVTTAAAAETMRPEVVRGARVRLEPVASNASLSSGKKVKLPALIFSVKPPRTKASDSHGT